MERFTRLSGRIAWMPAANVDTDVIMPKTFLKGIDRAGLAYGLFHDLRFDQDARPRLGFLLNRPKMQGTRFLLVGPNFGCGSSREHAVWGMLQYGIRAIIGTSFAGIFADNAANNGLLLISLDPAMLSTVEAAMEDESAMITIDLETQSIDLGGSSIPFAVDPRIRRMMMLGLDRIGETLDHAQQIRDFEQSYLAENPWLADGGAQ